MNFWDAEPQNYCCINSKLIEQVILIIQTYTLFVILYKAGVSHASLDPLTKQIFDTGYALGVRLLVPHTVHLFFII